MSGGPKNRLAGSSAFSGPTLDAISAMPPAGKAGDAKAAAPAAAPADAAAKPAAKDAKGKAKPKAKPLKEGADPAAPGAEDGGAGTADAAAAPQPTGADEAPALPTDTFEGILPLLDWESIPDREKFERHDEFFAINLTEEHSANPS